MKHILGDCKELCNLVIGDHELKTDQPANWYFMRWESRIYLMAHLFQVSGFLQDDDVMGIYWVYGDI